MQVVKMWSIDPVKKKIHNLLKDNPQGSGFNELYKQTRRLCAKDTLRKKLNELLEEKLIEVKPEDWRPGQQKLYSISGSWELFNEHIHKIVEYGNHLYVDFLKLKYVVATSNLGEDERKELLADFPKKYMTKIAYLFVLASVFSANYAERLKGSFFYKADVIAQQRWKELRGYYLSLGLRSVQVGLTLDPIDPTKVNRKHFLAWLQETNQVTQSNLDWIRQLVTKGLNFEHTGRYP